MSDTPTSQPPADESRFEASRFTLFADRFMTHFIKVGGIGVIVAVAGIFVFILAQILPLFRPARVKQISTIDVPRADYRILGVDEWSELPFLVDRAGKLSFVDIEDNGKVKPSDFDLGDGSKVTTVSYLQEHQLIAAGTDDGRIVLAPVNYRADFSGETRRILAEPSLLGAYQVGEEGRPLVQVAYADSGDTKMAAAIQDVDGKRTLHVVTLKQKRSLIGKGKITVDQEFDLTGDIKATPDRVLIPGSADGLVVSTVIGEVIYFKLADDELTEVQRFRPFEAAGATPIASMNYLLGQVSLVFTDEQGENIVYSLYINPATNQRQFGETKSFRRLPGPASFFARSLRNKAFLVASGKHLSLRYGTTQAIRYRHDLDYTPVNGVIASKYNSFYLLDTASRLHRFSLDDPHPEAGFAAFFRKIWYEGYSEPDYTWQSTGGTDDFEPKLSMVNLIIGTLKGTFFAMIFAVPIAILAAVYCSQFQHPRFKSFVKPTMEIMASLPSVVLGFLAALWLAPILETRVPSCLMLIVAIPTVAMLFGWIWSRLPRRLRILCPEGYEFLLLIPIVVLTSWGAWELGPVIERIFFTVKDASGHTVADFRLWWPQVTGARFEQRNALVVGIIMGFAVIPIIFTITEDALSNVPKALTSASLALGATRWQTAFRVVLPTASAGIFSACMIGLGRAVGETMIVLMATGNTPIRDFNIFTGMRTLSANIAVELPEAPLHGTLYRTLFLGAFLLFLMTFVVNTLAEILRQHLRNKYKTV